MPLLNSLPTITTVIARSIYNTMQAQEDINASIVLGEMKGINQVPNLLDEYLLAY